ncbi:hypothetical protein SAMN05216257_10628 [Meinhardsimonia xiamenensis]|jgi:high-affinity Fe2+/Pb2+ permease|uniref:Uncharacterized protein n=1 Tax=Meinhardsimonia xiamenensis TaxID=990712 RepID=A0A1G9FYU3_9RHOB|nr:hypothetical protein [Meinhardsimonia xiamenensis]PRX32748.1 hypothetical protein LV81_02510 [Meinhardsimonia xiamenensis]SDK93591.1 hypothetical protein SAMN05216257_10628 [Meinhardsimonia xiamenensis]
MPLDRLVLIIVIVLVAAAVTVWLGALIFAAFEVGGAVWLALIPAALVGYIVWRVIAERLSNSEDDRYDRIEK